jgi:hypothetical protein
VSVINARFALCAVLSVLLCGCGPADEDESFASARDAVSQALGNVDPFLGRPAVESMVTASTPEAPIDSASATPLSVTSAGPSRWEVLVRIEVQTEGTFPWSDDIEQRCFLFEISDTDPVSSAVDCPTNEPN